MDDKSEEVIPVAENNNNAIQHGINAAQANAENEQEQQQVQELSSLLQSNTENANAASSAVNEEESDYQ
ncbi:hypothetical protein [Paenibacillus sp. OAS669]|uniref:hypothetical protein n=1 Tax=Paenibacillus sp. OAS669 TaxID=2663821 RepID=UPI00178C107D|nr:hypothetical protein [Paenibacillus sp. OAS669]MBE1443130.1 hypothetical protein [Paenibacillus sp. OAS669]